jgi:hypothetical protein
MTARTCMACGSDVAEGAARCPACGVEQEEKLFHEGSDVRLEVDRLGELLPNKDLSLPAERWGRASEHPKDSASGTRSSSGSIPTVPHVPRLESDEAEESRPLEPESRELVAAGAATRIESPLAAAPAVKIEETEPLRSPLPPSHEEVSLRSLVTPEIEVRNVTGPHATGAHAPVMRPPVLASEALQRDLTPAEPAPGLLRFWSPALGLLGVAATWLLTRGHGIGAPLGGAFAALALLGLPRMPYAARAGAIATVAATGLAVVLWAEMGGDQGPRAVVLTLTVTLLAAGLFFRAWHRASALSRFMVSLGILLGASFLWMSGGWSELTMMDTAWQSWAPRLVSFPFGILLMLSLLSFMNARTTAGAAAWATFVLLWYALYTTVHLLHSVWPKTAEAPDFTLVDSQTMLALGSAPIFSALLALGLAQLIAAGLARSAPGGGGRQTYFEQPIH